MNGYRRLVRTWWLRLLAFIGLVLLDLYASLTIRVVYVTVALVAIYGESAWSGWRMRRSK